MKKQRINSLLILVCVFAFISTTIAKEPEFDGCYVKLKNGEFLKLDGNSIYTTQIQREGMQYLELLSAPNVKYIPYLGNVVKISVDKFLEGKR